MTDVDVKAADIELKVEEGMDCDDSEVDMDVHEESALDECRRFCAGLMAGVVTKQEEFEKQLKEELRKEAECIGEKVQGVLNEVKEVRQEIERFKTESAAMFSTLNLRVNQCGVSEIKNELERFKTESATELSKLNLRVDQCDVSEIKNELEGLKNDSSNIIDSMDKKISACAEKFITAGLSSLNPNVVTVDTSNVNEEVIVVHSNGNVQNESTLPTTKLYVATQSSPGPNSMLFSPDSQMNPEQGNCNFSVEMSDHQSPGLGPSPANVQTRELGPSLVNFQSPGPGPSPANVQTPGIGPSPANVQTPEPGNSLSRFQSPEPGPSPANLQSPEPGPSPANVQTPGIGPSPANVQTPEPGNSLARIQSPEPGPSPANVQSPEPAPSPEKVPRLITKLSELDDTMRRKLQPFNKHANLAMTDKLNEAQRSFVKWYVKNTLTRGRNRRDLERLIKEGEKLPIWTCSTVVEDRPVLEYLQYRVKYEQDKLKPSKSMLQLFEEEKQKKMEK